MKWINLVWVSWIYVNKPQTKFQIQLLDTSRNYVINSYTYKLMDLLGINELMFDRQMRIQNGD